MASSSAPGPSILRLVLRASGPLVNVIAWYVRLGSKTIVSPLCAAAMAARNEPSPLSALFSTVSTLNTVRSSSTKSCGTLDRRGRDVRGVLVACWCAIPRPRQSNQDCVIKESSSGRFGPREQKGHPDLGVRNRLPDEE